HLADLRAELRERVPKHLPTRADELPALRDALGDLHDGGHRLDDELEDGGEHTADALARGAELAEARRGGVCVVALGEEAERGAEAGERVHERFERGARSLDACREARREAREEVLDAVAPQIDVDEEVLEPRVLGAVQLFAHCTGEAALLEELREPSEGELDAVPHAREEVGDAADVVPEGDNE